ncbi:hypothetical protein LRM31_14575 [Enterobacter kobei]|uniref:tail fiber/spike domain-containing protein n=1 Tax=Enterobacter cloacae complex TaxID=354276 RepID=UPI001F4CA864|nr:MULTISPECIES: hypothetical protein [Enterobacter cloacae complex]MCQ4387980.1 hypothetical protein [Enterobacter cloacae]UNE86311.1 hypothetical protein LRM31_14575 [Enterobacter kobei]HDC4568328.1 hypothetical protein [Enterobacter cloacae]HDC4605501.1 hypothetical protein [Enterobacter cloacae]
MATQPTNLPVPSESPRDLKFNAGKIDEFVTSFSQWYVDRFGVQHYTIEGLKQLVLQQIYNLGWNLKGTFQGGGTVTAAGDLLQDTSTGIWYRWDDLSSLPKTVPAGSTPSSAGGTGPGKWQPVDVADVLRKDLAKPSGAGLSGYDATVSYPANTVGAELNNRRKNMVFATADAGIPNDGSDVSTQVSTFLNANKGKFIVFDSGTYMFAGVVLSGTGWEGTTIYFKGKHLLKPDTTGTNTPGYGGFIGLILTKTVNDLTLYYRGDGNRTLQYNREHIFNVAIYGSTNLSIPYFKCDEIRGDGLYINSEDQTSSSAQNATNINIGIVLGRNSSIDGRNLISIVSCNRGNIKSFISENIGGVVGGFQQPGGLDVEPNNLPGCLVRDFVIEYASSIGAGGVYLVTDWTANPKKIQNCHVLKALVRNGQKIRMYGTDQSSINGECISSGIDSSVAAEGNTNGSMTVRVINCVTVALLGTQSTNYDCKFTFYGRKISNAGVITGGQYRCDMDLDFDDWIAGGNMIGLWFRDLNNVGSLVQNGNRIKLRCPKTTNISRAIQYTPGTSAITFSGDNVLYDSIFTDWPTFDVILGAAGQYLTKEGKMPFLTTANGVPSNGTWRQGDFVYYANPSTTNKFYGFYRITTGSGNVNGTDWGTVVFS